MHPAAKVHLFGYLLIVASLVAVHLTDKKKPSSERRFLYILGYLGKGPNIQAVLGALGVAALCLGAALIPARTSIFVPLALRNGLRLAALLWFIPFISGISYIEELFKNFRHLNPVQIVGQSIRAAAIGAMASLCFVGSVDDYRSTVQNSQGQGLLFFFGADPRHSGIVLVICFSVLALGLGVEWIGKQIKRQGEKTVESEITLEKVE